MNKEVQDKLLTIYLYNLLRAMEQNWHANPTNIPLKWKTLN